MTTPDNLDDSPEPVEPASYEPAPITRPVTQKDPYIRVNAHDRRPPASQEAEEHVLAVCLLDEGQTLRRALDAGLKPDSFYFPAARLAFEVMSDLQTPSLETLVAELQTRRQLEAVGGMAYLMNVVSAVPTTAHAGYFIEKVRTLSILRESIKAATRTVEEAYSFTGDIDGFLDSAQKRLNGLAPTPKLILPARPLGTFSLPQKGDPSVLVGNRWLSRGDIAILASTSGMGKSSLSIQAAVTWGLGRKLFDGFAPHRPLKSLIFQAEDGEGDIAEVRLSMEHAMKLTEAERATVNQNVIIVTDRIHRGLSFRAELKRQIALHAPDIVWINPLLAFIGGDVNDSTDVGAFLREQLNSLNEPASFAYIIVHHTAKPPKEKKERQWNEVMYEMAGSADLTNAARAILCLQATNTEGEFKLVAAKRGQRAGLMHMVPGTVNPEIKFEQATSTITLRHSRERMVVRLDGSVVAPGPGITGTELPVIHWERCEGEDVAQSAKPKGGRPSKYVISDFMSHIPMGVDKALSAPQIWRKARTESGISESGFKDLMVRAFKDGAVYRLNDPVRGAVFYI